MMEGTAAEPSSPKTHEQSIVMSILVQAGPFLGGSKASKHMSH